MKPTITPYTFRRFTIFSFVLVFMTTSFYAQENKQQKPIQKNSFDKGKALFADSEISYDYLEYTDNTGRNIPYDAKTDSLGNTYITGAVSNPDHPQGNFATIKVDTIGQLVWEKRKSGVDFANEMGKLLTLDQENNPISTGIHWNGSDYDMHTVKYDKETGDIIWSHTFDSGHSGIDIPTAITMGDNEDIYISGVSYNGNSNYDYIVLKYDNSGDLQWQTLDENLIEGSWNEPTSMAVDSNGNIAITGFGAVEEEGDGYWEGIITKMFDNQGNLLWSDSQQVEDNHSQGRSLEFDHNDNLYVTGSLGSKMGTIKYDSTGTIEWEETYQHLSYQTEGMEVLLTDSTLYIAGRYYDLNGQFIEGESTLVSYDLDGNKNWENNFSDIFQIQDTKIQLDEENHPIVVSFGGSLYENGKEIRFKKIASNGDIITERNYTRQEEFKDWNELISIKEMENNTAFLTFDSFQTDKGGVFHTEKINLNLEDNEVEWSYNYDSPNSKSNTKFNDVAVYDSDHNLYVVSDYFKTENTTLTNYNSIAKYSPDGNIEWKKEFNELHNFVELHINSDDELIAVFLPRGGYGDAEGNVEYKPFQVKKFDTNGALVWEYEREMNLPFVTNYLSHSFIDEEDDIYVVGNESENEEDELPKIFMTKISNSGSLQWEKYFAEENAPYNTYEFKASAVDNQGNLIITGKGGTTTMTGETSEILTFKIDENGEILWYKEFLQDGYVSNTGVDLKMDNNTIYIASIRDDYTPGGQELLVLKLDEDGEEIWSSDYNQANDNRLIQPYSLWIDSNGDLIIPSRSTYFANLEPSNYRTNIIKMDQDDGNIIWEQDSEIENHISFRDVYLDNQDVLFILNQEEENPLPYKNIDGVYASLIKIDNQGQEIEEEFFYGPEKAVFDPKRLIPLNEDKLIIGGQISTSLGMFGGVYFLETDQYLGVENPDKEDAENGKKQWLGQNYPNPVEQNTQIPFKINQGGKVRIDLYNIQGQWTKELLNESFPAGEYSPEVNLEDLNEGIYIYQIKTTTGFSEGKKLIKKER